MFFNIVYLIFEKKNIVSFFRDVLGLFYILASSSADELIKKYDKQINYKLRLRIQ